MPRTYRLAAGSLVAFALVASVLILLNQENEPGESTLASAKGPQTLPISQQVDNNYQEDGIVPEASDSQLYTTPTAVLVQAAASGAYDEDPDHADDGTDVTRISDSDVQYLLDNIDASDDEIQDATLSMAKKLLTQRGGIHQLKSRIDIQKSIDQRRNRIINIPTICADGEACDSLKKAQTNRFAAEHPSLEAALSADERAKELAGSITTELKKVKLQDFNKANMTLTKFQMSASINDHVGRVKDTARAMAKAIDRQAQADQSREIVDEQVAKQKAEEEEKKLNEWKRQWQEAHDEGNEEEKKHASEEDEKKIQAQEHKETKEEGDAEDKYWSTAREKASKQAKEATQGNTKHSAKREAAGGQAGAAKPAKPLPSKAAKPAKPLASKAAKPAKPLASKAAKPAKPLASKRSGGQKKKKTKKKENENTNEKLDDDVKQVEHEASAMLLQEEASEAWPEAAAQVGTQPSAGPLLDQTAVTQLAAWAHAARASATSLKGTLRAQLREVRHARKQLRQMVAARTMPAKEEALKRAFMRVAQRRQQEAARLAKEQNAELHTVQVEMENMLTYTENTVH